MTRNEHLKAIREAVRDLGVNRKYFNGQTGEVSRVVRVLTVPVVIVCEDDACTEVEACEDGTIEIMGWDGSEGLGDNAEKFSDADICKLYNAILEMAA